MPKRTKAQKIRTQQRRIEQTPLTDETPSMTYSYTGPVKRSPAQASPTENSHQPGHVPSKTTILLVNDTLAVRKDIIRIGLGTIFLLAIEFFLFVIIS